MRKARCTECVGPCLLRAQRCGVVARSPAAIPGNPQEAE